MDHDPTLMDALEPGQLTTATLHKLPRRNLARGTLSLLVQLRVYVVIAIPIVCYAFVHALLVSQTQSDRRHAYEIGRRGWTRADG